MSRQETRGDALSSSPSCTPVHPRRGRFGAFPRCRGRTGGGSHPFGEDAAHSASELFTGFLSRAALPRDRQGVTSEAPSQRPRRRRLLATVRPGELRLPCLDLFIKTSWHSSLQNRCTWSLSSLPHASHLAIADLLIHQRMSFASRRHSALDYLSPMAYEKRELAEV